MNSGQQYSFPDLLFFLPPLPSLFHAGRLLHFLQSFIKRYNCGLQEYIYSGCNFVSRAEAIHLKKNLLKQTSAAGLLPAWSKIYSFAVIVADLRR